MVPHAFRSSPLPALLAVLLPILPAAARASGDEASFLRRYGPGWTIWNGPGGVPYRVFGPGAELVPGGIDSGARAKAAVRNFASRFAAWLGLGAGDTLRLEQRAELPNLWFFRFRQVHAGLPVRNGFVEFCVSRRDGKLAMFGSEALPNLPPFPKPALLEPAALERFRIRTGWKQEAGPLVEKPALEILRDAGGTPRLAWRIAAAFEGRPEAWRLWIDAVTGEEIDRESLIHECALGDLKGTVLGMASPKSGGLSSTRNPPKLLPLPGVRVNVPGIGSAWTDANGAFVIPYAGSSKPSVTLNLASGRWVSSLMDLSGTPIQTLNARLDPLAPVKIVFNNPPVEFKTSQTNAFKYVNEVHDFVKTWVPTMTVIDRAIRVKVNYNRACNAYFSSAFGGTLTFFRKSGNCNNTASASVIAHEYGHFVDWRNEGIGSPARPPSEGIADMHAIYFCDDPVVGRDFRTNGGAVRTGLNRLTHPLTGGSQRVHVFGQPYMGFSYDLLVNARKIYGKNQGTQIAAKAMFRSLPLNGRDMLDAILKVYLADDDDSSLSNGTPHMDALALAAWKRHFIRPVFGNLKFAHRPLSDRADASKGLELHASVRAVVGQVLSVGLFVDPGLGSFRRISMTKDASGDWVARTPSVPNPGILRYYFVATGDRGNVERLPPENGDAFLVAIGRKRRVFFDDFETSGKGWTASNGASPPGWMHGSPFGHNYDPPRAFSGTRVFGVNRSATDERFYRSGTWTLTSKPLSTLGRTGMRLRFRRWMTTDSWSSGKVLVNGVVVHQGTRTNDQAWRTFDLDVSAQADNRASVVLAFQATNATRDPVGGMTIDDVELYALGKASPGSWTTYGSACRTSASTLPAIGGAPASTGGSLQVSLRRAPAKGAVLLTLGASRTKWFTLTLPLPLRAFGAPGCSLLASPDLLLPAATTSAGAASLSLPIPNDPLLAGKTLYLQWWLLDPKANSLGLVTSDAAAALLGG